MDSISKGEDAARILKAFDTVSDWSKQITAIASATLVLSATFIKDLNLGTPRFQFLLLIAWIVLLISILAGVFVLASLAAYLNQRDKELDVYCLAIRLTALAQIGLFLIGMACFIFFVYLNMKSIDAHVLPGSVPSQAIALEAQVELWLVFIAEAPLFSFCK